MFVPFIEEIAAALRWARAARAYIAASQSRPRAELAVCLCH